MYEISIEYLKELISDDFGLIFLIIFLSLNLRYGFYFIVVNNLVTM